MTEMPGSAVPTGAPDTRRIVRFGRTERAVHAVHAVAFAAMLVSGIALYLPALAGRLGTRGELKAVHLGAAAAWVTALLLVAALGDRRRLRTTVRELERFDADDLRWLRGRRASQGRFNAGQKLHSAVQAAFSVLFLVSGVLLWAGEQDTRLRLDGTVLLHDGLTVAAAALAAGHVYLSLVHPPTRPALRGMVSGTVDAAWAREHHAKWVPPAATPVRARERLRSPVTWVLLGAAASVGLAAARLVFA